MAQSAPEGRSERSASRHAASDRMIKYSTAFAVLCVATVAAVVSYDHAYALVREYGEDGWAARFVPLTVDGLIYASSMVLLHSARGRLPTPRLARWLLGVGIAATLAANAAHGLGHGPVGAVVAAWPAVALVGSYELLMLIIRRTGSAPDAGRVPDAGTEKAAANPLPVTKPEFGAPAIATGEPVPEFVSDGGPLEARAVEVFASDLASSKTPTIRAIRAALRVGQPKAQQVRAYLSALISAEDG